MMSNGVPNVNTIGVGLMRVVETGPPLRLRREYVGVDVTGPAYQSRNDAVRTPSPPDPVPVPLPLRSMVSHMVPCVPVDPGASTTSSSLEPRYVLQPTTSTSLDPWMI